MVERVTIDSTNGNTEPTLEESALALGINPDGSDDPIEENNGPPEGVPEKFWNAETGEIDTENLLKSYKELEKGIGDNPEEAPDLEGDSAEEIIDNAGLDFAVLSEEYAENGELSSEAYKALSDSGIPKDLVDQYIAGQQSLTDTTTNSMYDSVGGKEAYGAMLEWASDSMNPAETKTFNNAVTSGDVNQMTLAVKGLEARFKAEATFEPKSPLEGGNPSNNGSTYRSMAELMTDMNDVRYKKDAAFRGDVEQKLGRSSIM